MPEVRVPFVDDVSHMSTLWTLLFKWAFRFIVQEGGKFGRRIQADVKGTGFASKDNSRLARLSP